MKKIAFVSSLFILLFTLLVFGNTELVGPLSREDILDNHPDWEGIIASYVPDPVALEEFKSLSFPITVEVVFGVWCSDSKEHVSAYFKIIELADNPVLISLFIGIPREKESREPFIKGKNIEKVPTFIVFQDGQEKGRIIEHPQKSIEEDLLEIINH
jgi:hypothetical protein